MKTPSDSLSPLSAPSTSEPAPDRPQGSVPDWLGPVAACLEAHAWRGGFCVALPAYRPDLSRIMAAALALRFIDFRAEFMAKAGWQAGGLPLSQLDAAAETAAVSLDGLRGVVLHNAESLLAAKPAEARKAWLASHVQREAGPAVLVPVTIYAHELADTAARTVRLQPGDLPPESLLMRLATS